MKKIYLTITTAICLSNAVHAQKLEKPDIDKIKGDTTWSTSEERIYTHVGMGGGEILYASTKKIDGGYVLALKVENANGPTDFSVGPDNVTNIKFADNTVLNVKPTTGEQSAITKRISNGTKTAIIMFYTLSKENIDILKTKLISVVRVSTNGAGNFDFEIKPKNADLIKREMDLILTK